MGVSRRGFGLGLLALAAPRARADAPVVVFAAASLKTVLDRMLESWGGSGVASYAGSGALARQVMQGAP
ncbi:MAG: molybdate ABC transporter substrate-binding protein, partial [Pseudomonadota bacterium]